MDGWDAQWVALLPCKKVLGSVTDLRSLHGVFVFSLCMNGKHDMRREGSNFRKINRLCIDSYNPLITPKDKLFYFYMDLMS